MYAKSSTLKSLGCPGSLGVKAFNIRYPTNATKMKKGNKRSEDFSFIAICLKQNNPVSLFDSEEDFV